MAGITPAEYACIRYETWEDSIKEKYRQAPKVAT